MRILIRNAGIEDIPLIHGFILELAEFEKSFIRRVGRRRSLV